MGNFNFSFNWKIWIRRIIIDQFHFKQRFRYNLAFKSRFNLSFEYSKSISLKNINCILKKQHATKMTDNIDNSTQSKSIWQEQIKNNRISNLDYSTIIINNSYIQRNTVKMISDSLTQHTIHFTPLQSQKKLLNSCGITTVQSRIYNQHSEDHKVKRKKKINQFNKSINEKLKKLQQFTQIAKKKNKMPKVSKNHQNSDEVIILTKLNIRENCQLKANNSIFQQQNKRNKSSSVLTSPSQILENNDLFSSKQRSVSPNKKISSLLCSVDTSSKQTLSFVADEEGELDAKIAEKNENSASVSKICLGKATQFKILKFLDEGKFGKVYLAKDHRNNMICSVKSIYKSLMDESNLRQLIREVKIQSYLNHPNIVKLYNFFVDQQSAYLVLEPCLGKNLYSNLKEKGKIPEIKVKDWVKQICNAVQYLHKNDIIHRDIKPENILLHENMVKICDFGWAVHSPLLRDTQCGTPLYTPPEIILKDSYDSKVDIWSIGILTYELLYGSIPFQIRHINDMAKIIEQQVYYSREIAVSQAAKDFMKCCLHKDPFQRSSIMQLLQHQFLNNDQKYRWTIK